MINPLEKTNVLFVIIQMALGGSERLVVNLVKEMDREVFNPHIAWFHGDEILPEFKELNVPLFHVPKEKRFDLKAMLKLGGIIRDCNISVVNAHHFMSMVYSFYGSKIKNKTKLIYTEHSEWEINLISKKWLWVGAMLLRSADKTVGVSNSVTNRLQKVFNLPQEKVLAIDNGVDLKLFSSESAGCYLREELHIKPNEKIIGIVANLKKVKNHLFLLRAFREVVKEYSKVKLIIIGQGFSGDPENSEDEIRNFVDEADLDAKVCFLGFRDDVHLLLSGMDIFCLTSYMEGMPISLIEAMASGLPVVGSDVMGIKEIIKNNENGYIVSVDDVSALKGALLKILRNDDLREKMGHLAKSFSNHYSLSNCKDKYIKLFMQ